MAADGTLSSHTSNPTSVHSNGQEETSTVVNSTSTSLCSPFPRVQSPVVTLLQKRRDGTIPKGAIYMLGVMSYEEAKNRKHYEQDLADGQTENKSNSEVLCSENQEYKHENVHTRQSSSECKVREESSFVQRQCKNLEQILEAKQPEYSRQVAQPMRIEDYEPGQCSAVDAIPVESQYYNPPVDKPGQHCLYTDNSQGFQWQIRKHGPMSPTQSELSVHELYRKIQKGGHIPEHGLQMSIAEFRKGHSLPMSFHVRDSLSKTQLIDGHASPRTRQQRDLENAMRHMRLERIVAEEKLKRLAQQHRENLARRHSDFFTPLQKAPVSLNRYDDDMEAAASTSAFRHSLRNKSSNVRGKARALYTFRAQSDRELSFRKGDYLYLLRQVDKNWFLGERHGLRGIFPVSYVEIGVLHRSFQ